MSNFLFRTEEITTKLFLFINVFFHGPIAYILDNVGKDYFEMS